MLWTYEGIVLRLKKNIIKPLAIKHTSNKLLSVIHSKRKLEADQQHHHLFFLLSHQTNKGGIFCSEL